MPLVRDRLPLACIAFGSIALACWGIRLMAPATAPFTVSAGEIAGMSLPLTVAWFSFSGTCVLSREEDGLPGLLASWSRFAGQAALIAGVPIWAYWYLHLVFGVL